MFWGMVLYNNEFNRKGNKVSTQKIEPQHIFKIYCMYCGHQNYTSRFFARFGHGP